MRKEGIWLVPSQYEMLAEKLKSEAWPYQDEDTWLGTIIGILSDLHEATSGTGDIEKMDIYDGMNLHDAIWARLAHRQGIDFDTFAEGDNLLDTPSDTPSLTPSEDVELDIEEANAE